MGAGGRECVIGGCPLFVVLTRCDLLAQPGDQQKDWVARVEARKREVAAQLQALLPAATSAKFPGFGSVTWHVHATALRPPQLNGDKLPETLGLEELAKDSVAAALDLTVRQARQPKRLYTVLAATIGLLLIMFALVIRMAWRTVQDRPSVADSAQLAALRQRWLEHHDHFLDGASKLLYFDGYRAGAPAPVTDWPRWRRDADKAGRGAAELLAQVRTHGIQEAEAADLTAITEKLAVLRDRAGLFGLAGEADARPAAFVFPKASAEPMALEPFRQLCQQRLRDLREHYPTFHVQALPDETPIAVQRELERTTRIQYERLLDPVRVQLINRVRGKGNGQESPEGWRELANGYLTQDAPKELADWQELGNLLLRFSGQEEPREPLEKLTAFLRQEQFPLPLATLSLLVPQALRDADGRPVVELRPRVEHPLTIRLRTPKGDDTMLKLVFSPPPLPVTSDTNRFHFVAMQPNDLRDGRLLFRPGDAVSASLQVFDKDGHAWTLSWPLAESPSAVYSFALLNQAPRLHRADQADSSRGSIAFGVRFLFSEPERMALPDLMPR